MKDIIGLSKDIKIAELYAGNGTLFDVDVISSK
jgi:hypothetical protein